MSFVKFKNEVFGTLLEEIPLSSVGGLNSSGDTEGIITSIDEVIALVSQSADAYYSTFKTPDRDKLVLVDEFPRETLQRLNEGKNDQTIDQNTLRDIRVVTYTADEVPASVGKHAPDETRLRNIKPRPQAAYPDPIHDGFSIIRYVKDIEAHLNFQVWGLDSHDIRKRAKLLRNIINTNIWYYKKKGLGEIVWTGSAESEMWDKQNIVKMKSEKFFVRFTEVTEVSEKNIEQILIQAGLA